MTTIQLFPFQFKASQQIANRYFKLAGNPRRPSVHRNWDVPFYQALSALTGAGKTPILADAVSQIRTTMAIQPIVLWTAKWRAVVDQTYMNFEAGGKYHHLIDPFNVCYLSELTTEAIADGDTPFLVLSTVGTFNQKDKADGTLGVHKARHDFADSSLWDVLTARDVGRGQRRPLIVVYDEAQNLTDQQTELLLDLEPDAILVASATMKTPGKLGKMIDRLKDDGWSDVSEDDTKDEVRSCLVTTVSNRAVVDAGLVKRQVVLGGYTSIMETMLDDMVSAMDAASTKAAAIGAGFEPKAIYVCKTNISQDDGTTDLPSRPFDQRRAPPILIWRYLVEQKKVDPATIAVYCDLKFDRQDHPPPEDFKLFSGGDQDFGAFSAGNFKHIIFNQSLQEGWDDPACCFAYIDKSMGSQIQVEQVIGRVLRQPGAKHHPDPDLNTATFFIRLDDGQEFPRILKMVQGKLGAELPEVKIEGYTDPKDRQRSRLDPRKEMSVPEIHIDASEAVDPLAGAVTEVHDYRRDANNTVGRGEMIRAVQAVGQDARPVVTVLETEHSNRVTARWIARREMLGLFPEAAKAIDWANPIFDARIEITSRAATSLRNDAERLVDVYIENSDLVFEAENPFVVGPVLVNPAKAQAFRNALHASYELNGLELKVAEALDDTGHEWCRNPVNGGYSIPLLDKGDTRRFFPDFLCWKDGLVFALDPKGGHLLKKDAGRKLLNIQDEHGDRRVYVRFISEGKWDENAEKVGPKGFTVFSITRTTGRIKAKHVQTVAEAVEAALKP